MTLPTVATLAELRTAKTALIDAERAFHGARETFLDMSLASAIEACPYRVGDRVTVTTYDGYVEGEVLAVFGDSYDESGWCRNRRFRGDDVDVEPYRLKLARLTTKGKVHSGRTPGIYGASAVKGFAFDYPAARLNKEAAAERAAKPLRVT